MKSEVVQGLPVALPESIVFSERIELRLQIAGFSRNGFSMSEVMWLTGSDGRTVDRWITRFEKEGNLFDLPRTGRPLQIQEDMRVRAVAFYCQVSPVPGCRCWSLRWAEAYLEEHDEILGRSLSRSSLHRILHSHPLKPHLYKYFLQITDPDFFPKMEHIISLYLEMPDHFFLFDECPNLQALKRKDPPMQAEGNYPNYESHDYTRHGTLDLMTFLNPKNGEVFGRCTADHKTVTLIPVFKEHVATQPKDVQLHYLMDNLSPHYHNDFCKVVAELCDEEYSDLKRGAERRQWLQSPDKRIVIHFTPFHGSWLNMVEIWFGIFQQKCINHVDFHSVEELQEAIEDFVSSWNMYFKHPFTWRYDGHGLHEKAVRRFIRLLFNESRQMDSLFIRRQCLLMNNLIHGYRGEVSEKEWENLHHVWKEKRSFAENIVQNDPGPIRRERAMKALAVLDDALSCFN